jgi:2'-5' RNA ligase
MIDYSDVGIHRDAAAERRYHYHVSPSHNREDIQQQGLDKNKSGFGPRVYLSDDAGERRGRDPGYDVWKVDTTGIPLREDKIDGEGAWYAQRSIHPDRLTLHRAGEPREQMHYHGASDSSVVIELDVPQGLIHNVDDSVEYGTHVTIVYCGKGLDAAGFGEVLRRAEYAASWQQGPLTGTLSGLGTFPPSKSSDGKVPAYIPVNVPGIDVLHKRLEDLSVSEHKGYIPHVTLAYCEPGGKLPPPHHEVPITFTHLTVRRGKDEAHRFPFGG